MGVVLYRIVKWTRLLRTGTVRPVRTALAPASTP